MDIATVAFDNMAALDAIGPFEVLAHLAAKPAQVLLNS